MVTDKRLLKKLDNKEGDARNCMICGRSMSSVDWELLEYVKTKRNHEIFIHTECVKHWGD